MADATATAEPEAAEASTPAIDEPGKSTPVAATTETETKNTKAED